MSIFTVSRVVVSYDTVEIDVDAIRETIPATITQEARFGIFGDKGTYVITRPNVVRMAADAITITSVRLGDSGEIRFHLNDRENVTYSYYWYPSWEDSVIYGFYRVLANGELSRSELHHLPLGIEIPFEKIALPDDKEGIMPRYQITTDDLNVYFSEIMSYGSLNDGVREEYINGRMWQMH